MTKSTSEGREATTESSSTAARITHSGTRLRQLYSLKL
jgi:hypothetical protein